MLYRKILLFFVLLFPPTAAPADYRDTIDVYILSGQSNCAGGGYVDNLDHPDIVELTPWFPRPFVIDTRVQILYGAGGTARCPGDPYIWTPLTNCNRPDEGGERFGPEIGFGNRMMQLDSNAKVAIIKFASSASSISRFLPGGDLHTYLVKAVDSGMVLLEEEKKPAAVRGMLWHQGESDGGSSTYAQKLVELITFVRTEWNAPDMPFVYGSVGGVYEQQKMVVENSGSQYATPGAVLFSTDGFQTWADEPNSPHPSDNVHYGTAGQLAMGKVMADSMFDRVTAQRPTAGIAHQKSRGLTPELSAEIIQIDTPESYSLNLFSLNGRRIWQKSGTGPENLKLPGMKMRGVYIVTGQIGNKALRSKIVMF